MLDRRLLIALVVLAFALPARAAEAPAGAAACSGCHATSASVATKVPRLVGRNPAELVAAMQGYKNGKTQATVMDRIAKGFSDDEITAIADWYGAQKN